MMQEMNTLYLESLEHRRLVTDLTLVYQILHGQYDTQLDATFCITDNPRTRGHAYKLLKPIIAPLMPPNTFSLTVISWLKDKDWLTHSLYLNIRVRD